MHCEWSPLAPPGSTAIVPNLHGWKLEYSHSTIGIPIGGRRTLANKLLSGIMDAHRSLLSIVPFSTWSNLHWIVCCIVPSDESAFGVSHYSSRTTCLHHVFILAYSPPWTPAGLYLKSQLYRKHFQGSCAHWAFGPSSDCPYTSRAIVPVEEWRWC